MKIKLLLILLCSTLGLGSAAAQFKIGQEHLGGIIVILNKKGTGGMIMQKTDFTPSGTPKMNWHDARRNVALAGSEYRLPTGREWEQIYLNNNILKIEGQFWSSNDNANLTYGAWAFDFATGKQYFENKNVRLRIRTIALKTF